MHFSSTVPNPLGRLNRIPGAVEESHVKNSQVGQLHDVATRKVAPLVQDDADLDDMSLSRCERSLDDAEDPLGFLSLTHLEDDFGRSPDGLSKACLEWTEPRRPDH